MQKSLISIKRSEIKNILNIAKTKANGFIVDVQYLNCLEKINGKTRIKLIDKITGLCEFVEYRHFKQRGKQSTSQVQLCFLYIAEFYNKKTKTYHLKPGSTGWNPEYRYHGKSEEWEFIRIVRSRIGSKNQIKMLEQRINSLAKKTNINLKNVRDFTWGGKTELLIQEQDIPISVYINLLKIFDDDGIDSL